MSEHDTQPLVTEEHLNLSLLAPRARKLTLSVKPDGEPAHRPIDYKIRGRLDTDRMVEFLQLETQINEALKDGADAAADKLVEALDAGNTAVRELLLELNPAELVPAKLHLDEQQTLMTLAWISGDVSVADAIARVITAGVTGALSEEELDDADPGDAEAGAVRAGSAAPLP